MKSKIVTLNKINNGYAVFLIFIPIIGVLFFEPLFISMFGADTFFPIVIGYAIINVSTIIQDEKQLKKANIKINNAIIWGAVLVPVYCYLRGSRMNKIYNLGGIKSQWVFISWMGSFFVSLLFTPY
jgi:hypothetical protein